MRSSRSPVVMPPHALAVLKQFVALLRAQHAQRTRQYDCQRRPVRQSVQRRQFVADHVGRPVLSDAHRDEAVESHRRREHEIGHQVVVVLVLADFGCDLDERLQMPSAQRSITRDCPATVIYCSMTCTKVSASPRATCRWGSVKVFSGSSIEKSG